MHGNILEVELTLSVFANTSKFMNNFVDDVLCYSSKTQGNITHTEKYKIKRECLVFSFPQNRTEIRMVKPLGSFAETRKHMQIGKTMANMYIEVYIYLLIIAHTRALPLLLGRYALQP